MNKFNWQDQYFQNFKLKSEDFKKGPLTLNHLEALVYLFQNISDDKICETTNYLHAVSVGAVLNFYNKINTLDLIEKGSGHFKNKKEIKENMDYYSDNFVAYRMGDNFGKRLFDICVANGCCGQMNFDVFYDNSLWKVHFNFGH